MSFVTVEKPRPYGTLITLNRPERMNAMAFDVMVPFREALEEVSFDNDTRVVVVTGAGDGFCAGADLEDPGWLDIFNGLTVPGIARRAFEIMLTGRDVTADEAQRIGMVSKVVAQDALLDECYAIADRISGFSRLGVELSKQMLWAGVDAGSLHTHMNHEGHAQLFVRMTTKNFEEAIKAREEGRTPLFKD